MMRRSARSIVLRSKRVAQEALWLFTGQPDLAFLWFESRNWGDAFNRVLIEMISGRKAKGIDLNVQYSPRALAREGRVYLVVGSTLSYAERHTIVWGAGFIGADRRVRETPDVRAVRGPLTREALLRQGVACPPVFGDPALLCPRLHRPPPGKRYRLGVIPHVTDVRCPALRHLQRDPEVKVINIRGACWDVVNAICACERVASSSLHGLILADAYDIPATWVTIGDRIVGGTFKFLDYYASMGQDDREPMRLDAETSVSELIRAARSCDGGPDLDALLEACPFRSEPFPARESPSSSVA